MCSAVLLLCLLRAASAQPVEFSLVTPDLIRERLEQAPMKNRDRMDALKRLFELSGCRHLAEQAVKGSKFPNVICTLPGQTDTVILTGAHFDHVSTGQGVVDNWSGAALLPSLYRSLSDKPRHHTYVFAGFTDEEKGMVGSRYYAGRLTAAERARHRAMVNLDTLGLSPTKIWLSRADKNLSAAMIQLAATMKLPVAGVNVEQVGSSDSESFAQLKIPRIAIHSVTQETLPILHSRQDRIESIRFDDYYTSYRLLAAYLAYLDQRLRPPDALEKLSLAAVTPLDGTLHHVQGIDLEGDRLWVTSVDSKTRTGWLHLFEVRTARLVREVEVQEGDRFHPGGIALDGGSVWVPVAEYTRTGKTTIQRRNKQTLALESRFEVNDHIGCVAADRDGLLGGNWDSRQIYSWDRKGRQLAVRDNPTGTRYQDMKLSGGLLVAGGLRSRDEGAIDWLDPVTLKLVRRLTTGKTDRGVVYTNEGMTLREGRLYLLPEDGPSRLFCFELQP